MSAKKFLILFILLVCCGCTSIYQKASVALSENTIDGATFESFHFVSKSTGKSYNSSVNSELSICIEKLESENTREKVSLLKAINELKECMNESGWETKVSLITITS